MWAITFSLFTSMLTAQLQLYIYWHWYWHVEAMWNSARKLRADRTTPISNHGSRRIPFKHNDEIAPLQTQAYCLPQQAAPMRSVPHTSPTAEMQAVPENMHADAKNASFYRHAEQSEGALHMLRTSDYLTASNENEKLLVDHGKSALRDLENNNDLPQCTLHSNGCLHFEPEQQPAPSFPPRCKRWNPTESAYFSSRGFSFDPSRMHKPWHPCRDLAQSYNFSRRFGSFQRSPLVKQPAQQYLRGETSPRRHANTFASLNIIHEYPLFSPQLY